MKILVLNCGSSSLKFQLIDMENEERMVKGNYERIGGKRSCLRINIKGEKHEIEKAARSYEEAIKTVLNLLQEPKYNLISSLDEISAVGHRIVHGGEKYNKSAPQVIVRWLHQRDIVPIVRSGNPVHQKDNLDIFDFELTDDEMDKIFALDKGEEGRVEDQNPDEYHEYV